MVSITKRLSAAASIVLAGFVGFTGFALEKSYRESAEVALKDRLQGFVFTLLAASEIDANGLTVKDLPDARFYTVNSGLYAKIISHDDPSSWDSPSSVGTQVSYPDGPIGQYVYKRNRSKAGEFMAISFSVVWEVGDDAERQYTFSVAENLATYQEQVSGFRQHLWSWLGGLALVLLSIQVLILRWGLRPLHQVADDLTLIQAGDKNALEGEYPSELSELTDGLNDLLQNERAMQTRYRHSLGDLAHSLKTPLAVLQGEVEQCEDTLQAEAFTDQIERMNRIVKYQLQRAVSSGGGALTAPLAIAPIAEKIFHSLVKVYRDKSVETTINLDEAAMFHGGEGDLYEIVGNLSDNAFKWCDHQVSIQVVTVEGRRGRAAAEITIEDDGPGVPDEQKQQILKRGVRADEKTPGWGIGLSIVMEIIDGYGGSIIVKDSALGGAKFEVRLP